VINSMISLAVMPKVYCEEHEQAIRDGRHEGPTSEHKSSLTSADQ
jgi:hypothetical protein